MRPECCRHPRASRGFAVLIEIIIVAVLLLGGVSLYLNWAKGAKEAEDALDKVGTTQSQTAAPGDSSIPGATGRIGEGTATSLPGRVVQKAAGQKCMENLRQVRMLVEAAKSENGDAPANLSDVTDTALLRACPVGGEDYVYDPASGRVSCPHPGHEGY